MNKVMLAGENGSGKGALIRALSGMEYTPRRALAVEFFGPFINTPGEFLENRRFYRALITASADASFVLLVQHAARASSVFPPGIAVAFNRKTIGVISHTEAEGADLERAERFLRLAGAGAGLPGGAENPEAVVRWNAATGEGMDILRAIIDRLNSGRE